ncbi:MAG TPA: undecaprenyldiphospho-muramoylpentapeptide beta-N-acetylglucosaminyltransferase [Bacteroidales bacterium]|nr:undecaprenyldiphospho-muramoylpentapeptide beta-N-acetylglucosaminyltransferase [Bacteroidales bacterium]
MNETKENIRVIISGGGTGGHIFPALSIANALRRVRPEISILFVGAQGRMEMTRVPEAGYEIKGLPVAGFIRNKLSPANLIVLWKLFRSMLLARKIIRNFKPQVVIGVGGYASGPVLKQAQRMGIPTLIQEQNSYAGVTNRLLAARAARICVAYDGMEKYFPADRIIKTGNPVRQTYSNLATLRDEAFDFFGLEKGKKVILVLGGSLGAGAINNSIGNGISLIAGEGVQMIWQTGSQYLDRVREIAAKVNAPDVHIMGFINRMELAYAAADVIITRAGAGTISELQLVGKPAILMPSPNVAEDHQTHNAMALVDKNAAVMIRDSEADEKLLRTAFELLRDEARCRELSGNIKTLADRDADEVIANEILKLIRE